MPTHIGHTDIRYWLEQVDKSNLSVSAFFSSHKVPFSQAQYYRYKRKVAQEGFESITKDMRVKGNRRTLTTDAEAFLEGCVSSDPLVTLAELRKSLEERYQIDITESGISKCLKRHGRSLKNKPKKEKVECSYTVCGGFELISALACHKKWPQTIAATIKKRIQQLRKSKKWEESTPEDKRLGRNERGQFTSEYSRLPEVRKKRFDSIENKSKAKNYKGMSISSASAQTLAQKSLAMLSLPVITNNGVLRTVDAPLGNALQFLCGYNYKQKTLNKFMAELKYLGLSEHFLKHQIRFWQRVWKEHPLEKIELPILCYYVDGNTRALWSKRHVRKNKVTMLGRVMGCIETLFVHDNFGRPIYFESYPGKAPMGEYILGLFQKIEELLEGPGEVLPVNRAIVMDAAGNSVRTLRAFAAQNKYHYISSLDDNQWNPRKIRREGRPKRYRYGKATLTDCEIELEDSQDKGYLITTRAIKIEWDYGKRTVIITSFDQAITGASEVVKAYFERWPDQELQLRSMKEVVSLNRITGYGMQQQKDRKVVEKQKELQSKITALREELADSLSAMEREEAAIVQLVKEERKLRALSKIEDGKRILPEKEKERFGQLGREIAKIERTKKKIMKPKAAEFKRLRKLEREWLRLQGKEKVYKIDVELDTLMTFFRIGLVNLYNYLAYELFGKRVVSMNKLVQSIMLLPAIIEERIDVKRVILGYNKKDPDMMRRLKKVIAKINALEPKTLRGKKYEFSLEKIGSQLISN